MPRMTTWPAAMARGGLALAAAFALAPASAADGDFNGQLRLRWDDRQAATQGPLASASQLASQLAPSVVPPPRNSAAIETELRGHWKVVSAAIALRQERPEGGPWLSNAAVNELYASAEAAGWQFSGGRKIVAWDVGYGFRPNDVVQQEQRRTLLTSMPQGRALLQAEHFNAQTAWSLVWVNPQRADEDHGSSTGPDEQALALRVYRQAGAADWHGFARLGEHTRGSLGVALAWVATDSVELHASARWADRADAFSPVAQSPALAAANPYRATLLNNTTQALIGMTWTGESKLSLIAEAWYDGTAASNAQWDTWALRNRQITNAWIPGGPDALRRGVTGNLGWQAQAFNTVSLRRSNLFVRAAWDHEGWQPTLDMLYMPADGGRIVTAALAWQGDRLHLDAGLRMNGGPAASVARQLPVRRNGFAAVSMAF